VKERKIDLPKGVALVGGIFPFRDLHRLFAGSSFGERLANSARFTDFKPPDLLNDEWEDLLGADVNNLRHLVVTHQCARQFLACCANPLPSWKGEVSEEATFSAEEQEMILLMALSHDWQEAIVGVFLLPR